MTSDNVTGEERYSFFKIIDFYMNKAESAEGKRVTSSPEHICKSFLSDATFMDISFAESVCVQFKHLYDLLYTSNKIGKTPESLDNTDCSFLNFWLNDKLRGVNNDPTISVKKFYQNLMALKDTNFKSTLLENKLYNIEGRYLENMRKLYDLYNMKNKVSEIIVQSMQEEKSSSCSTYIKECYGKYRDAIINCLDGCFDFYTALTDFRNKYRDDFIYYPESSTSCKSKELFELPDCETVLKEHKSGPFKRIITLPVLFPLLGMFFMFIFSNTVKYNTYFNLTPFRQKAFEKIKSTKNMLLGAREKSNELLSYTSYNDNIIGDHEEYSIRYYSVGNY
ncbi:PIR protein [Plasmodium ovale]|uniref:PIR protein n=1 Tax=Plasmodium ovale TaxID=36330 RepID=A0A1C3KJI6_PLAOA|nr:PIR protein [Plasmodium ovale]